MLLKALKTVVVASKLEQVKSKSRFYTMLTFPGYNPSSYNLSSYNPSSYNPSSYNLPYKADLANLRHATSACPVSISLSLESLESKYTDEPGLKLSDFLCCLQ